MKTSIAPTFTLTLAILLAISTTLCAGSQDPAGAPDGWSTVAPRDEIRPAFSYRPDGGPDGKGSFIIQSDERAGRVGWWTKTFPIEGGKSYAFRAVRRCENVAAARRSVFARVTWLDAQGHPATRDASEAVTLFPGTPPQSEPEFPLDHPQDAQGWTEVSDTYQAPKKATQAVVELCARWAPGSLVEWGQVSFAETPPLPPRIVRLAAVHFVPQGGKSAEDNRKMFVPLIEDAARQRADLVVLGETLTYAGTGRSFEEVAEPVPGPSTEFFGALAKKHNLHIVAPLVERDGHLLYNTAALVGPDGQADRQVPQGDLAARRMR